MDGEGKARDRNERRRRALTVYRDLTPQERVWLRQARAKRKLPPYAPIVERLVEKDADTFPCRSLACAERVDRKGTYCIVCRGNARDESIKRARAQKAAPKGMGT